MKFKSLLIEDQEQSLKDKSKKISFVFVRATPIMETLTGIMIAILIWYSGKLILSDELKINNFFSFLAAMMLAYQPVRSLATLSMGATQGLSAARRILPILDIKNNISEKENSSELKVDKGNIKFKIRKIFFKSFEMINIEKLSFRSSSIPKINFSSCF